jgi:hypothetical protein
MSTLPADVSSKTKLNKSRNAPVHSGLNIVDRLTDERDVRCASGMSGVPDDVSFSREGLASVEKLRPHRL